MRFTNINFSRHARYTLALAFACVALLTTPQVRADGQAMQLGTLPPHAAERRAVAMSATEALAAMSAGQMSSEQYVGLLLDRIARYPELNAIIHLDPGQALADARATDEARAMGINLGALHGLPILFKDSINTATLPTSGGTPALAGFQPLVNAPVVQALLDEGAILFGKTNLHELSGGYTTTNPFTGPTANPYDFSRVPGGSSGGNGAALAARLAPLAIGEDTAGSTRIPAALTGTVGFRPTTGRYSATGVVPISPTLDAIGPMARSVEDLALADAVLAGEPFAGLPDVDLTEVRLGVPRAYFYELLDPSVQKSLKQAFARLEEAGIELVEADLPFAGELTRELALAIVLYEVDEALEDYLDTYGAGITVNDVAAAVVSPLVAFFLNQALAGVISDAVYLFALDFVQLLLAPSYSAYLAGNGLDAVILPSNIAPAPEIGDFFIDSVGKDVFETYNRTGHFSPLVGAPTVSIPIGQLPNGLPVGGIDVAGAPGDDRHVLAIAASMKRVLPRTRPPLDISPLPAGR